MSTDSDPPAGPDPAWPRRDTRAPRNGGAQRERIVDAALALGEARGWDAVHLHDVAAALGIALADIQRHFGTKDAIAEAWFDRADRALLAAAADRAERPVRERLHRAIFAWLDALSAHRALTAQMLRYKLQLDHLHLQALGLVRISRTVQWIREVAGIASVGWRREVEEVALTTIYLSTFAMWLRDDSEGAARTHAFLDRALQVAERAALRLAPQGGHAP
jgi:ubiquinone biosynthesis protein COQ9